MKSIRYLFPKTKIKLKPYTKFDVVDFQGFKVDTVSETEVFGEALRPLSLFDEHEWEQFFQDLCEIPSLRQLVLASLHLLAAWTMEHQDPQHEDLV